MNKKVIIDIKSSLDKLNNINNTSKADKVVKTVRDILNNLENDLAKYGLAGNSIDAFTNPDGFEIPDKISDTINDIDAKHPKDAIQAGKDTCKFIYLKLTNQTHTMNLHLGDMSKTIRILTNHSKLQSYFNNELIKQYGIGTHGKILSVTSSDGLVTITYTIDE